MNYQNFTYNFTKSGIPDPKPHEKKPHGKLPEELIKPVHQQKDDFPNRISPVIDENKNKKGPKV